jgi:hypothetical protein
MREPQLIIATGTRGVGKTYTTCKVIDRYIRPNASKNKEPRKVLIFDINMEYSNEELKKNGFKFQTKIIDPEDLKKFSKQKRAEVRRILPLDKNGRLLGIDGMIDLLEKILADYRGGLLILEDINRYLIDTRTPEIIGTMATTRHRDLDIYIHLQSLAPVTTRMWQNCNFVRFHKQIDDVNRFKQRLTMPEVYFIAQTLVNIQYKSDKRFFCYVDNLQGKISGKFSKKSFQLALYSYIIENPKVNKAALSRFGTGKDNYEKATKFTISQLTDQYYGN